MVRDEEVPRSDTRTVKIDELNLMYAMIKRKKVSPVKLMISQWLEVFTLTSDIGCASLFTWIAANMGLLENALVSFTTKQCLSIDFD
jgi:hypothetical protein